MNLLVTGGAGFIGCNFVRFAVERGHNVFVLDKLTYAGKMANLEEVKDKIIFVKGDICDKMTVDGAVKSADIVINFAAETHVDRSIESAEDFVKTNVNGVYTLLEACRKHDKKFLQISTDEVYGSIDKGSFTEESCLTPRNPYSATKASADLLAKSYHTTHGLRVAITRSCNNFGYCQDKEKFMPTVILNALRNNLIPVYGDGKNIRDWIFALDNCSAIETVLLKGDFKGGVYNISAYQEMKNIDLVKLILDKMGKPHSLIKFVADRPGHDLRYSMEAEKIREIGWKPQHRFEDSIKATIEWYKGQKDL